MKCTIHFFLLNEHFSLEHAEANFDGKESESNRRYEWEDELEIKGETTEVNEIEKGVYSLAGTIGEGESFSYDVPMMRLFEVKTEGQDSTFVGCSESILDSAEIEKTDSSIILKVYLKDYEPMSNPIPGIYIAAQEFPKALIQID